MTKTATRSKAAPKTSRPSPSNSRSPAATPDAKTPNNSSLPKSLVNALPVGARIAKLVQEIESWYPELVRQLGEANKAGPVQLARAFVVLHRLNERMLSDEKAFKQFKNLWSETKSVTVPACFEQAGVENVPLTEGFRVGTSATTRASIVPGKKGEAFTWLEDHGAADLIQPVINASTLSAYARELGEANKELPSELFNVALMSNTSVTKTA